MNTSTRWWLGRRHKQARPWKPSTATAFGAPVTVPITSLPSRGRHYTLASVRRSLFRTSESERTRVVFPIPPCTSDGPNMSRYGKRPRPARVPNAPPITQPASPASSRLGVAPPPTSPRPDNLQLDARTHLSENGIVKGAEFERRIRKRARRMKVVCSFVADKGKGSHGRLYFGYEYTTLRDRKRSAATCSPKCAAI
jgi:hypothetical protein